MTKTFCDRCQQEVRQLYTCHTLAILCILGIAVTGLLALFLGGDVVNTIFVGRDSSAGDPTGRTGKRFIWHPLKAKLDPMLLIENVAVPQFPVEVSCPVRYFVRGTQNRPIETEPVGIVCKDYRYGNPFGLLALEKSGFFSSTLQYFSSCIEPSTLRAGVLPVFLIVTCTLIGSRLDILSMVGRNGVDGSTIIQARWSK